MKKISILINKEAQNLGLYYGYWNWFLYFKKELLALDLEVKFYSKLSRSCLKADFIFLNSRSFKSNNDYIDILSLKKIYEINSNIYWFDMRDSAGTTQFEVLPYVKKYIKKQLYIDRSLYYKNLYGGRYYTDFYHKKFNIEDKQVYKQTKLENKFKKKIILGWNIGVAQIFDYSKYSRIDYWKEYLKFRFLNKKNFELALNFSNNSKKINLICLMNKDFKRETISFQRKKIYEFIENSEYENCIYNKRLNKKEYLKNLKNAKISLGSYGWGEICYREFEAVRCGASFITADMSNIDTWPNIYFKNETYLSYNLDFSDISEAIKELLNNHELRTKFVKNSQEILRNTHNSTGKKYFINKLTEILS